MLDKKALDAVRNRMYADLQKHIEESIGHRINRVIAKSVFEKAVKVMFDHAAETGYIRLPAGLGVVKKVEREPIKIQTPYGDVVEVPKRVKLKHFSGTYQRNLLLPQGEKAEPQEETEE